MTFGQELMKRNAFVMHRQTMMAGVVTNCWSGQDEDVYVSPENGLPVYEPVIQLDTGHTFLAHEEFIIELDEFATKLFQAIDAGITVTLAQTSEIARTTRVPFDVYLGLAESALRLSLVKVQGAREEVFQ